MSGLLAALALALLAAGRRKSWRSARHVTVCSKSPTSRMS
jgi:hypothetical protein